MGDCVVIPIGVTGETVAGILGGSNFRIKCIVAVTVPGFREEKESILQGVEMLSQMLGAELRQVTVVPRDASTIRRVYEVLRGMRFSRLVIVGVTGSRYLLPLLISVALKVWRDRGGDVEVLLLHGVEGEDYTLEPLVGFVAPVLRISGVQQRVLSIVYGSREPVSGKDLIEKHGFTRSVYYVLADLERKGLLRVRRGRIEKTLPGEIYYLLALQGS